MEYIHLDQRNYICGPSDYNDIFDLHLGRKKIHGVYKTDEYNARYPTMMRVLLKGLKKDHFVIGCRSISTGKMLSYAVLHCPKEHPFGFIKFAETDKLDNSYFLSPDNCGYNMFVFAGMLFAEDNKLDYFLATRLGSFNALARLAGKTDNQVYSGRLHDNYQIFLHRVITPEQKSITLLEQNLLPANPLVPRITTLGIFQVSMKQSQRVHHFFK